MPPGWKDAYCINFVTLPTKPVPQADFATMIKLLDERILVRKTNEENAKKDRIERLAKFMAAKEEDLISGPPYYRFYKLGYGCDGIKHIAEEEKHTQALKKLSRLTDIVIPALEKGRKEKEEAHEAKVAEELAKAEAKRAEHKAKLKTQVDEWVDEFGTDNQKARHAEGMLSLDEVKDYIRAQLYDPMKDWPRYEKIQASDFCTCEYDPDIEYSADLKPHVTAEEYDQLQALRKLMPTAEIEIREHEGKCSECDNNCLRTGFMVRITTGELKFSREYAFKI